MTTKLAPTHKYRTRQEIFNRAVRGLEKQGWVRAVSVNGHCLYRGPNKTRCAIGRNIPDTRYEARFDARLLFSFTRNKAYIAANISKADRNFANSLQLVHDLNILNQAPMRERMKFFAIKHNLKWPLKD